MSLNCVYISHKNSLNIKVNFECTKEKATASVLIDSGMTENFIDVRTAERWGLPQKILPRPRPIVNVDGTENKAGMVTEACILEVLYKGDQCYDLFPFLLVYFLFYLSLCAAPCLALFAFLCACFIAYLCMVLNHILHDT